MIFREIVEAQGRAGAGVLESIPKYNLVRVLNSFEMYVSPEDASVSPHLARDGFWESWITTWFMNNVRPTDLFLDIGAHTGYYSFLARYIGADVISFEPNPAYTEMIRASASLEGRRDLHIQVLGKALSDHEGIDELHIPTALHGSASLNDIPPGYDYRTEFVSVTSLDAELKPPSNRRVVLKIDAEGEEERVLAGGREFIDKAADVLIAIEYTPEAYSDKFVGELFRDWHVSWISHSGFEMPTTPEWLAQQTDWQMVTLRRRHES